MAKKKSPAKMSIEEAMEELQTIVSELETGQESLESSLTGFERGMALLKTCHERLDAAAQRIEIVTGAAEDGTVTTEVFDTTATSSTATDGSPQDDAGTPD